MVIKNKGNMISAALFLAFFLSNCSVQSSEDDEDEAESPTTVASTETDSATTTTASASTTGTIRFDVAPYKYESKETQQALDLVNQTQTINLLEISTDGTTWVTLIDTANSQAIDLISGGDTFSFSEIPTGTYKYVYIEFDEASTYSRLGDSCTQQSYEDSDFKNHFIHVSPEEAANLNFSFTNTFFPPSTLPSTLKSDIFPWEGFLFLEDNIVVSATEAQVHIFLSQGIDVSGESCDDAQGSFVVNLGTTPDHHESFNATDVELEDPLLGTWVGSCVAAGDVYVKKSITFYKSSYFEAEYSYFPNSSCTSSEALYHLRPDGGFRILGDNDGLTGYKDLDLVYNSAVIEVDSSTTLSDFNSNGVCGFTDWTTGSTKEVENSGTAANNCPFIGPRNRIVYSVFNISDNNLRLGDEDASTTDGSTAVNRLDIPTTNPLTLSL